MARKKYNFEVLAGTQETGKLYYSGSDAEARCIGHLRGDFGSSGTEFWTNWFPHVGAHRNDKAFQDEFSSLVKTLRRNLLKNRVFMQKYLREHDTLMLESGIFMSRGYMVVTEQFEYYIRCQPQPGDYNFYIYAYVRKGV
jgi:hypothetical protein